MQKTKSLFVLFILVLFIGNVFGQIPAITSISPLSGQIGSSVVLTGTNFSTTPSNNKVTFGGIASTVTAASAISLTVTVPVGATFNTIQVQVGSLMAMSKKAFDVTKPCSNTFFSPKVEYTSGADPYSVAVGDFNGDGNLDLASTSYTASSISILLGNGIGTFGAKVDYPAALNSGFELKVGDFNGDGNQDLVSVNSSANTISVFFGTGTGAFGAKVDYATGSSPFGITIGDFNGDGKQDLAVANFNSSTVSIFIGSGTGTFAAKVDYTTDLHPRSPKTGDFNGDGNLDLVTANNDATSVSILLGTGTGTFGGDISYQVGIAPSSVTVGDFNGDGKLDLAAANKGASTISILLGIGNGTFGTQVTYAAGFNQTSIAVGDFNGDGNQDLVTTYPSFVSIFLGNGVGTFAAKIDYPSLGSQDIVVGDFNKDGSQDFATVNLANFSISVYLNNITTITPSVSVSPSTTTICAGTNVTFTATPANGGVTPSYQWKVGAANVGSNLNTYSSTTLNNGDVVTCVMTSSDGCASPSIGTSAGISIIVNPILIPLVSISASATSICVGKNVLFTAIPTNGGTTPSYAWKVGASTVGTTSSFSSSVLTNGALVTCVMTSNVACPSPASVTSNTLTMNVTSIVATAPSDVTFCGNTIQLTGGSVSNNFPFLWKVISGTNVSIQPDTSAKLPTIVFPSAATGSVILRLSSPGCAAFDDVLITQTNIGVPTVNIPQSSLISAASSNIDFSPTISGALTWSVSGTGTVSTTAPYYYQPSTLDLSNGAVEIVATVQGTGVCNSYYAGDTIHITLTAGGGLYSLSGSITNAVPAIGVSKLQIYKKLNGYWVRFKDTLVNNSGYTIPNLTNGEYQLQVLTDDIERMVTYYPNVTEDENAGIVIIANANQSNLQIALQQYNISAADLLAYLNGSNRLAGRVTLNTTGAISNLRTSVVDPPNIKPVENANVVLYDVSGNSKLTSCTTNSNGYYIKDNMQASQVNIEAQFPGTVLEGTSIVNPSQTQPLTIVDNTDNIKNIQLVKIDDASNNKLTAVASGQYFSTITSSNIYPNPAKSEVYISLLEGMKNQTRYKTIVFDEEGKPLETSTYEGTAEVLKLDVSGLGKGIYQIYITTGNKSMVEKLLVVE